MILSELPTCVSEKTDGGFCGKSINNANGTEYGFNDRESAG